MIIYSQRNDVRTFKINFTGITKTCWRVYLSAIQHSGKPGKIKADDDWNKGPSNNCETARSWISKERWWQSYNAMSSSRSSQGVHFMEKGEFTFLVCIRGALKVTNDNIGEQYEITFESFFRLTAEACQRNALSYSMENWHWKTLERPIMASMSVLSRMM